MTVCLKERCVSSPLYRGTERACLQVTELGVEAKWPQEHLVSNHCCARPLSPLSTATTSVITHDIIHGSFDLPGCFSSVCWVVQGYKREYQSYVPRKDKCLSWCFFMGALQAQYNRNAVVHDIGTHKSPLLQVRPQGVCTPLEI